MPRVFVDTNVLFPFSIMDLLLALTEDMVHEVLWTERLLAEWERVIVREHQRSPASARAITSAIRECFADNRIPEDDYSHLTETMPGGDPDDRHHMAAALAGRASVIVTWNLSDFPSVSLAALGMGVVDPDTYLCQLLDELSHEIATTVVRLAGEKRRPPMTPEELLDNLAKAGVPDFAERLGARLGTR
ncbi:PIN domain-containing protein [Nocardiopsis synnemataformans]|uniref:PIN domain-containing protein n=1 Tax=Nocardiopsis synnemataformans TaxID=61305 RepID=UPI003EBE9677